MLLSRRALAARFQVLASALVGRPMFWLVFIVTMFSWPILRSIHAERALPGHRPVLGRVRDFTLRDQNGGELGAAELHGRIWVASFTAIDCAPTCVQCQRVLTKMAEVRHRTRNLGDAIRLVTFTVVPERDTAERMFELSASYRSSRGAWRFVSGPPPLVSDVLRDFQVAAGVPQTRLALVDTNMRIRGYYDVLDEAAVGALLRDVSLLLSPGG
jgi:protein SCO1/2